MIRTTITLAVIVPVDPPDEGWVPLPLLEEVDFVMTNYIRNIM